MEKISLRGKRGSYSLVADGKIIHTGSNKERLRGIQYFLEANPEYANAPELLRALKNLYFNWDKKPTAQKIIEWEEAKTAIDNATKGS